MVSYSSYGSLLFFPETFGLGLEEMAQVFDVDISDMQYVVDKALMFDKSDEDELKTTIYHIEDKHTHFT